MSFESSLARAITRALIDFRAEKHAPAWTAARCLSCKRIRPFQVRFVTLHRRIAWKKWSIPRMDLCCDFCGQGARIESAAIRQVKTDSKWTPEQPIEKLVARTAPDLAYKKEPESDEALICLFDYVQPVAKWSMNKIHIGWQSLAFAFLFAIIAFAVTHFSGLGRLWMFKDNSGSPLDMIVSVVGFLVGLLFGARNQGKIIARAKLEACIKTYDLDVDRLRRLALSQGSGYTNLVAVLQEMSGNIHRATGGNRNRANLR
jgi:hypothetical protein